MISLGSLRREKRDAILQLGANYGARNIRVFGSVARGDNGEDSDVDFLVDLDPGRPLFDLGGLLMDLQDQLGVKVDIVTPGGRRYLRERIFAEAQPL